MFLNIYSNRHQGKGKQKQKHSSIIEKMKIENWRIILEFGTNSLFIII